MSADVSDDGGVGAMFATVVEWSRKQLLNSRHLSIAGMKSANSHKGQCVNRACALPSLLTTIAPTCSA
jgi:hypothetical protein